MAITEQHSLESKVLNATDDEIINYALSKLCSSFLSQSFNKNLSPAAQERFNNLSDKVQEVLDRRFK